MLSTRLRRGIGGRDFSAVPAFTLPFWTANLVNLLCLTGGSTFVLLPLYMERHGMHRWEIGLVAGAFSLTSVFTRPWLGQRMDRQGRRLFFVVGSALLGLSALAFLVAPPELPWMALLRAVQGMAMAFYFTAIWTWMADLAPGDRLGEFLGLFGISGLLSGAAGPVVGEWALERGGFDSVFAAGALLMLGAAFLSQTLRDRMLAGDGPPTEGFWRLVLVPALSGTMLASLGFGIASGTLLTFAAPFMTSGVGVFFTIYTCASVSVRLFAGRLADRIGAARVVAPALLCQAAGLALFSQHQGAGGILLAAALVGGTGHGLIYPALSSLSVQRVGAARRGVGVSLFTAVIEIGVFLGATASGVLAHHAGYAWTFAAVGVGVAGAAALHPLLEGRHQEGFPPALP